MRSRRCGCRYQVPAGILQILTDTGMASSKGEARRLIEQGGVSVDGQRVTDPSATIDISHGVIVKVGKRKFMRVLPGVIMTAVNHHSRQKGR